MEPHGFLSGKCKHGSSNFCTLCDIEGHPECYTEKLLNEVIIEVTENTKQPLSGRLQSQLMAYKLATAEKEWNVTIGEVIREPFHRLTKRALDEAPRACEHNNMLPNEPHGYLYCPDCGLRQ